MEVTVYNSTTSPSNNAYHNVSGNIRIPGSEMVNPVQKHRNAEIIEEVMMDRKEVQNFLYMLIGGNIKVSQGNTIMGSTVNAQA